MPNKESIQRSKELTSKAKPYFEYKTQYFKNLQRLVPQSLLQYFNATDSEWDNWKWQLKNRITNAYQLKELFNISQYEYEQINNVSQKYRFAITPYYLSLINEFNENDPIYLQSIPQSKEICNHGKWDPMNEINNNPSGAITRRYPDRLIINVTNCCAAFCRHCQRRRNIGDDDKHIDSICLKKSYEYIKNHPEIRDVLITGGDPLTLSDMAIDNILAEIRSIKTVEIIRIGTRTLVTLPQRITPSLIGIFKKYSPIYINTQFNHPQEITSESANACLTLANNGIVLGNQMVFLKNVNTDYHKLQLLNQLLLMIKVRPYYIFHPKNIIGTSHFSIPIAEGIKIYEQLRGNTSGLAIPTYIYNAEQGLGKIQLSREILRIAKADGNVTLETWEGNKITINIWESAENSGI